MSFREIFEAAGFMILALTGMAIVMGAAFCGIYSIVDPRHCASTSAAMGVNYHWEFWTGCLVEIDGQMEPLDWHKSVRIRGH